MSSQPDFYLEWGSDFVLTASGSIQPALNWDRVRQRIVRSFLTNSGIPLPDGSTTAPGYLFHRDYGLSGGALVDQNPTDPVLQDLKGRIQAACVADAATAPGSTPTITFEQPNGQTFEIFVSVLLVNGKSGNFGLTFEG